MPGREKLLIVDDDPHIRKLLRIYLRQSDYEVFEAANGEEATAQVEQHRFAVILLDLILPHFGGFTLCQKFKATEQPPRVVIITGEDSPETRTMAEECGADDFLPKPFTLTEVMAKV